MYYPILIRNTHKHPNRCSYRRFGDFSPHLSNDIVISFPQILKRSNDFILLLQTFSSPAIFLLSPPLPALSFLSSFSLFPSHYVAAALALFFPLPLRSLLSLFLSLSAHYSLFPSPSLVTARCFPVPDVPAPALPLHSLLSKRFRPDLPVELSTTTPMPSSI